MNQIIPQPPELVKFLTSIEVKNSFLSKNMLDDELDFISFYYTPNLQISLLAEENLKYLKNGNVQLTSHDLGENSFVRRIIKSGLKRQNSKVYRLMQLIVLEVYSTINALTENPENVKLLTEKDLNNLSDNINYVCDYLGESDDYNSIIQDLRNISLDIDFIKLQLPLIKKEYGET